MEFDAIVGRKNITQLYKLIDTFSVLSIDTDRKSSMIRQTENVDVVSIYLHFLLPKTKRSIIDERMQSYRKLAERIPIVRTGSTICRTLMESLHKDLDSNKPVFC